MVYPLAYTLATASRTGLMKNMKLRWIFTIIVTQSSFRDARKSEPPPNIVGDHCLALACRQHLAFLGMQVKPTPILQARKQQVEISGMTL